jgi:hypothetical protein
MNSATTSVIKNDDVRVGGRVRLDGALSHAGGPAVGGTAPRGAGVAGVTSARIVKTAPDHVMIEVTCACGTKTMLKCDY